MIVCKTLLFVALKGNVCPTNLTFPPDFTFLSVIAELHNLIVIAVKRPGANFSWRDGKLNFKGQSSQLSFFRKNRKFPTNHPIYLTSHDKIVDN